MCHFSELKLSKAARESPSSRSLCYSDQHCSRWGCTVSLRRSVRTQLTQTRHAV